ncbi:MAG TPA: glycine cleavage system aminomethyltransferase GcvT, partial [Isosphaeraceae bacterium]
ISHMGRLLFSGPDVLPWIERVTTNHVAKLAPGQVQYSLMVGEDGGVLDDILVYRTPDDGYSIVCNASNRSKVVAQLRSHKVGDVKTQLLDWTMATTMIAVHGPRSLPILQRLCDAPLAWLGYYRTVAANVMSARCLVSRTGYTGEDGFEISFAEEMAVTIWEGLLDAGKEYGLAPCGLGARDTLRFEAAMPLYGHEMDETINPYEAGLGWAVKLGKGEFVGREALRALKDHRGRTRVGLALGGMRIARQGAVVLEDERPIGVVTSGTFGPTLGRGLAMALVEPGAAAVGTALGVDVRGRVEPAVVVPLPFYRRTS